MTARRWAAVVASLLVTCGCSGGGASDAGSASPGGASRSAGSGPTGGASATGGSSSSASGAPATLATGAGSGPAAPQPYPAVLPQQAQRITDAVDAALASARTALDPTSAGARVVGPARDALTARLKVAAVRHPAAADLAAAVGPALTVSRLVVPQAGPWPRWFLAAGTSPAVPTPALRLYLSADARSPYGLWGQLNLLPGATLPEPAGASGSGASGAPMLAPTAGGLAMTPEQVAIRYADVLNRGPASAFAGAFTADTYRTQLNARLGSDRAAIVKSGVATLVSAHSTVPGAVYAVQTADGGALVVVALRQDYRVLVTRGKGAVTADPDLAALAGRSTFSVRLDRIASEVLAFHVPPAPPAGQAGQAAQVQLVAAGKADVSATGS